MIKTILKKTDYQTQFTNGTNVCISDTTIDKGGSGAGFRPHELLEAAFATCMNMSMRMYARKHSIPLSSVSTMVALNRNKPDEVSFEYNIYFPDNLSEANRQALLEVIKSCPVRQTLSKKITFQEYHENNLSDKS